jgi:hypothetical protein
MGTARHEPTHDADELEGLPPLDGDGTDGPESPIAAGDDLATALEREEQEGGEGLDDSTPASDGQNVDDDSDDLADPSAREDAWVGEPSDNQALDIGGYDLVHGTLERAEERAGRAPDGPEPVDDSLEPPVPDEEFAAGERAEGLDPAAEDGPVDADEELREGDLPALDADDQDTGGDDASLLDERLAEGESHAPVGVLWSTSPGARVGAPVGLRRVSAVACVRRGALVACRGDEGGAVVQIDLEGGKQAVRARGLGPGSVRVLAAKGPWVAAVVEEAGLNASANGGLFLSRNGADQFEALAGDAQVVDAAISGTRLWVTTQSGGLASLDLGHEADANRAVEGPLERHEVPDTVAALATDGADGVVALGVDRDGRPAALVRGTIAGEIRREAIELPSARPAGDERTDRRGEARVAARASFVALAWGGAVYRRSARGAWQRFGWDGTVTALTFVDDDGTLLAATYSSEDEATALVRVDPAGRPEVVALVGLVGLVGASIEDPDCDGRVLALACDDAHGVVWLAGGFGIAAFAGSSKV